MEAGHGDDYTLHAALSIEVALHLLPGFNEHHVKPAVRACTKAGCHSFGSLVNLTPAAYAGILLRRSHKKALRRSLLRWRRTNMAPLSVSQLKALWKLCAGGPSLTAEKVRSVWLSTCALPIAEAFSFLYGARNGCAVLVLESTDDEDAERSRRSNASGPALPTTKALGRGLLLQAVEHGTHEMVTTLCHDCHVAVEELLRAAPERPLPLLKDGPMLRAILAADRNEQGVGAKLLAYGVSHWTASAVKALLRAGLRPHHTCVTAAIRREREGIFDLFVSGGKHAAAVATPKLHFDNVKAALDARRADLVLRLLQAGAPIEGVGTDHGIADRLVGLWAPWLRRMQVDVRGKLLDGAKVRVRASAGLGKHKASALKLELVHSVLWALYASRHPLAATHHVSRRVSDGRGCTLADVRLVAPWVGETYDEESRRLFPAECSTPLEALRLTFIASGCARSSGDTDPEFVTDLVMGGQLGAAGQPLNLTALRTREQQAAEAAAASLRAANDEANDMLMIYRCFSSPGAGS